MDSFFWMTTNHQSTRMTYRSFLFFFQAEDGIRDADVTGVQTCALPILIVQVPFDGKQSKGTWTIIPATGRGDFTGITGSGSFEAPGGPEASYQLEYGQIGRASCRERV